MLSIFFILSIYWVQLEISLRLNIFFASPVLPTVATWKPQAIFPDVQGKCWPFYPFIYQGEVCRMEDLLESPDK